MSDKLPPRILAAEYDEVLNSSLGNTIERYWFDVTRVRSADEVLRAATVNPPHIAIISSRIQDIAANELAVRLRELSGLAELPIIFLVEPDENEKNYQAIDSELVAVLHRPYLPEILMTTIRALLRKSKPVFQDRIIGHSGVRMDLSTYKVFLKGNEVHLGPTEFKILQLLVQKPDCVFSRRQIIDYVWGTNKEIEHRTIDVHINRIRTLLKVGDGEPQLIRTIRSAGYGLN